MTEIVTVESIDTQLAHANMHAEPAHLEGTPESTPEISRIDYGNDTLRVTLHFVEISHACLSFKDLCGFRVLQQGDLVGLFGSRQSQDWLWEIHSGGWKEHESKRQGFVSGRIPEIKEYLVIGRVDCLSVLTWSQPEFAAIEP